MNGQKLFKYATCGRVLFWKWKWRKNICFHEYRRIGVNRAITDNWRSSCTKPKRGNTHFSNGNPRFLKPLVIGLRTRRCAGWQPTSMHLTPGDKKNTFIPNQDNLQITQSQADFPPLSFYPPLILLNLVIIENVSFFPWAELKKEKQS